MKTVAVVQARMGSTRLPNKVMKPILGTPMIGLLLERLKKANNIDQIIVATTNNSRCDSLAKYIVELGYEVFRGSEKDVLDRFYQASKQIHADIIVRITGDCPLIDSNLVDAIIEKFKESNVDYVSNISPPTYPDGLDTEVFSFAALEVAWKEAKDSQQREHVTLYIRESKRFSQKNYVNDTDESNRRWTVDEPSDFEVVQKVFEYFHPRSNFNWTEVLALNLEQPEIFEINKNLSRNEGAQLSTGQKLWKRAKQVIPGGNMLLSKRAEMFLPEQWPSYFSKSKGCKVWDLDGNEYIDMSIMGIGTNILGYGHEEVDEAVRKVIDVGNMSTFNCPEEVYLAEKLIELHPWAEMVRFARSGGEANAISIRIARAASGKDKVAICGYHGWHDWYLAANLSSGENLAGHLLPGLEPNGVPQNLQGSVLPFRYNNFEELESLVREHDIGVIKMEVSRNQGPEDNFLHKVRKLATKKNIVLIFDECTSGFRQTNGGLHKLYGVEPDMAIFGKALGNGYAITAIIGSREVMEAAQSSFISSTFWTERIGPSAALKTLEVMEREKSWDTITATGKLVASKWKILAKKYNVNINVSGLPALISFTFQGSNSLAYKTLLTQEMLAKGYLASTNLYVCTEHSGEIIDDYINTLAPVFSLIEECENGRDVHSLLKGPVCHSSFKRLN